MDEKLEVVDGKVFKVIPAVEEKRTQIGRSQIVLRMNYLGNEMEQLNERINPLREELEELQIILNQLPEAKEKVE